MVEEKIRVSMRCPLWLVAISGLSAAGCGQHQVIDPGTGPVTGQRPMPVVSQSSNGFVPSGETIRHVPVSQVVEIPDREEKQEYYEVRQGDTLSGIARAHRISLDRLLDSNGLEADAALQPGQLISLPPAR